MGSMSRATRRNIAQQKSATNDSSGRAFIWGIMRNTGKVTRKRRRRGNKSEKITANLLASTTVKTRAFSKLELSIAKRRSV